VREELKDAADFGWNIHGADVRLTLRLLPTRTAKSTPPERRLRARLVNAGAIMRGRALVLEQHSVSLNEN
jgi:hypothetical protein